MDRQESQRKKIKEWLLLKRPITPMMALQMFGCFRLASVIFRLRNEDGMNIETKIDRGEGNKQYATYYWKDDEK